MPVILGANSASGGYTVKNSLRFNSGSSDYLNRTPASAGNKKTFTFSFWFKISKVGQLGRMFSCDIADTQQFWIKWESNKLSIESNYYALYLYTTQLFRDVSAWYHIVVAFDTTQATDTNRCKVYINGSQVTAFDSAAYPSQNTDLQWNGTDVHTIGNKYRGLAEYIDGYMSDVFFIDGQALTPSSFGQTDPSTPSSGIWVPKAYTGTYGTNGFYFKFANSASLGTDSSGNGNNFTVNNLTSVDQSTDTPTNNFATLNPLSQSSYITLSNGNLDSLGNTGVDEGVAGSTLAVDTGKWYVEFKVTGGITSARPNYGIIPNPNANFTNGGGQFGNTGGMRYGPNGIVYVSNVNVGTFATFTTNDIIGIAIDATNGAAYISKNGVFQNSGNPTSGSSKTGAVVTWTGGTVQYFICIDEYNGTTSSTNFGSPNYTANSYADGAGFGNFSYAVPSGYYALCTKNLTNFG